jgi:hypothetical protein
MLLINQAGGSNKQIKIYQNLANIHHKMIIENVQETKIAITKLIYIKIMVHQITKKSPKHS